MLLITLEYMRMMQCIQGGLWRTRIHGHSRIDAGIISSNLLTGETDSACLVLSIQSRSQHENIVQEGRFETTDSESSPAFSLPITIPARISLSEVVSLTLSMKNFSGRDT